MTQLATPPPADARFSAGGAKRPDAVLVGVAAAVLVYDIAAGSGLTSLAVRSLTGWLLFVPFHLGTAVFAYRIARSADAPRSLRRFWGALSFTATCFLVGDVFQLTAVVPDPAGHYLSTPVQWLTVNVGTVVILVVMLTAPLGLRTSAERARFWLDAATVMAATAGFAAYFTIAPEAISLSASHLLRWVQEVVLGPVIFLVGVFVVVKLLYGGAPPFTRSCAALLGAAAAMQGVAVGLEPTVPARASQVVAVLNVTANGLLVAGARVQQLQLRSDPTMLSRLRRRRPYSRLPYVAIGATYALLVVVLMRGGLDARAWGVLGAAIISTGLVVVRQLAAFTENARLLTELDGKVHELNQTEEVLRASLRERDDLAAELHHLAFHDSLTGLPNRALFVDRVENALARARRHGGQVVVLLLDLDDFKPVNDRFGHAYGDELLKQAGERLRQCLRESDTAARLGGDEFAVLLEEPVAEGFVPVAERIVRAVKRPYVLGDEQVAVSASVGVAVDRDGAHESGDLLREADVAMYAAKHQGKGNYQVFTSVAAPAPATRNGPGLDRVRGESGQD
jgi:diguanylate cyclase (GGDEF)-like protein